MSQSEQELIVEVPSGVVVAGDVDGVGTVDALIAHAEPRPVGRDRLPRHVLRWPGCKERQSAEIIARFPSTFGRYVEPFAGSLSIYFALCRMEMVRSALVIDLNEELIRTYAAIRSTPHAVVSALECHAANHSESYYYDARGVDPRVASDAACAARLLYLNRACFNGIYKVSRSGRFNVAWGRRAHIAVHPEVIHAASRALQSVELIYGDYAMAAEICRPGDLIYADPPFDGTFTGYTPLGWKSTPDDTRLAHVCNLMTERGAYVAVSTLADSRLQHLLHGCRAVPIRARSTMSANPRFRGHRQENLVMNF